MFSSINPVYNLYHNMNWIIHIQRCAYFHLTLNARDFVQRLFHFEIMTDGMGPATRQSTITRYMSAMASQIMYTPRYK